MKKILVLICAISACTAVVTNDNEAKAQQGVVRVQGNHLHEVLTKKHQEGRWKHPKPNSKKRGDIPPPACWIDEKGLNNTWEVDSAYLLIRWTDGKGDDVPLVWGYRWNPYSVYSGDTSYVAHHTIDLIRAVANADQRFIVLLQYAGTNGYTVGGMGFNQSGECEVVPVKFDLASAAGKVAFDYKAPLTCSRNGQLALPPDPQTQSEWAVQVGTASGFIDHPFNVSYGYPAYDYDYWILAYPEPNDYSWQAGWAANGYWAFYVAQNKQVPNVTTDYASLGVTYQPLNNQEVHGFLFQLNFGSYDFSGNISSFSCDCPRCTPTKRK